MQHDVKNYDDDINVKVADADADADYNVKDADDDYEREWGGCLYAVEHSWCHFPLIEHHLAKQSLSSSWSTYYIV